MATPSQCTVLHHAVYLNVSLDEQRLEGESRLRLSVPVDVKGVRINASRQCRVARTTVDGVEATFKHADPLEIVVDPRTPENERTPTLFAQALQDRCAAADDGELSINFPPSVIGKKNTAKTSDGAAALSPVFDPTKRIVEVAILYSVIQPSSGVHFVTSKEGIFKERQPHFHTSSLPMSVRQWLPCLDDRPHHCTWDIMIAVQPGLTAVASGVLHKRGRTADGKHTVFHFKLDQPTPACSIGLCVGPFHSFNIAEGVTVFCLPQVSKLVRPTMRVYDQALRCIEDTLATSNPYPSQNFVFVDEAFDDLQSFACLSVVNMLLMHSDTIIDQTLETRPILARAICRQFFSHFVTAASRADAWLIEGIVGYLLCCFLERTHGQNELRHYLQQCMDYVAKRDSREELPLHTANRSHPYEYSTEFMRRKSLLVMRIIERNIAKENLQEALVLILKQAKTEDGSPIQCVSSKEFFSKIKIVSNQDLIEMQDMWVEKTGFAKMSVHYKYRSKDNMLCLTIDQPESSAVMGQLRIGVQEIETYHETTVKVHEPNSYHEIQLKARNRKTKRRRAILETGAEIEIDLTEVDTDWPIMWVRIDPHMEWLRSVKLVQPAFAWAYQAKFERNVVAQAEAVRELGNQPGETWLALLDDIVRNERIYIRVRTHALLALAKASAYSDTPQRLILKAFETAHCVPGHPNVPIANDFRDFAEYFIQRTMPEAMSQLTLPDKSCPASIAPMLVDLIRYNDNGDNKYSDSYYVGELVTALARALRPPRPDAIGKDGASSFGRQTSTSPASSVSPSHTSSSSSSPPELPKERLQALHDGLAVITRLLNTDGLSPSYRRVISCRCLQAIRRLQDMKLIPKQRALFQKFAQYGHFHDIRLAAIDGLTSLALTDNADLMYIMNEIDNERVSFVRYYMANQLYERFAALPPQRRNRLQKIRRLLWINANDLSFTDARLRCTVLSIIKLTAQAAGMDSGKDGLMRGASRRRDSGTAGLKLKLSAVGSGSVEPSQSTTSSPDKSKSKPSPTSRASSAATATKRLAGSGSESPSVKRAKKEQEQIGSDNIEKEAVIVQAPTSTQAHEDAPAAPTTSQATAQMSTSSAPAAETQGSDSERLPLKLVVNLSGTSSPATLPATPVSERTGPDQPGRAEAAKVDAAPPAVAAAAAATGEHVTTMQSSKPASEREQADVGSSMPQVQATPRAQAEPPTDSSNADGRGPQEPAASKNPAPANKEDRCPATQPVDPSGAQPSKKALSLLAGDSDDEASASGDDAAHSPQRQQEHQKDSDQLKPASQSAVEEHTSAPSAPSTSQDAATAMVPTSIASDDKAVGSEQHQATARFAALEDPMDSPNQTATQESAQAPAVVPSKAATSMLAGSDSDDSDED